MSAEHLLRLFSVAVLQKVLDLQTTQPDTFVDYFYFDFSNAEKQASQKAFQTLLFQLAQHSKRGWQLLEQVVVPPIFGLI
jgi:hypothetical protein